jgi:hypothetical protein
LENVDQDPRRAVGGHARCRTADHAYAPSESRIARARSASGGTARVRASQGRTCGSRRAAVGGRLIVPRLTTCDQEPTRGSKTDFTRAHRHSCPCRRFLARASTAQMGAQMGAHLVRGCG